MISIKLFSELSCAVNVGGVMLEESTPIMIEMFGLSCSDTSLEGKSIKKNQTINPRGV